VSSGLQLDRADIVSDISHVAYRICPFCEACCGLEVTLHGGRISSVRGHAADVFSGGYLCPKGVALQDLHEDPDRLRTPLIKRNGAFHSATWPEAYAEIERRLLPIVQKHGRQALAVYLGNPVAHKFGLLLYVPAFVRALGTSNVFSASTLDQMPKHLSAMLMFGTLFSIPVPDIDRSHHLLILGANPAASNGSLWTVPDFRSRARALRRRGGRIVVVDPRRTETAALADEHHFLRPGADVFLLLGIAATLIEENRVRLGRLAAYVNQLNDVLAAVRPFSPERVAPVTGLSSATVRAIARELSDAPSSAVYARLGTCAQKFGTLASWLVDLINVLTGNLDRPGGAMFPRAAAFAANTVAARQQRPFVIGRRRSRVSAAPEVFGEFPATCLAEEIDTPGEGQVRALFVVAGNPVSSVPNGLRLERALEQLDLMVSLDIYVNETSRHADVILPGPSPLEESHYDVAFPQLAYRNCVRYSPAVLPRSEQEPLEWESLLHIGAIAQGATDQATVRDLDEQLYRDQVLRTVPPEQVDAVLAAPSLWRGPERLLDLALRSGPYGDGLGAKPSGLTLARVAEQPAGIDLGALEPRIPELLRTPSGRIDLAPALLLSDLPRAAAALGEEAAPLVVIGRRHLSSNNSWMHNLPGLAKGHNRCNLLIHPDDALRYGLVDGARARLKQGQRAIEVTVMLTEDIMPGVVSLPHGWGHALPGVSMPIAAARGGANLNTVLEEDRRDPLSGTAVLSGVPVEIEAA
jgi:anaerobic selenocysteine-containing dehydrogenase